MNWRHIILPPILWLDTAVLIGSSITCDAGLIDDDQRGFFHWMLLTTALGVLFCWGSS